ncbi:glutamate ABC transporter substrate-binding protein [Rhodococcus opacus]|uniref:glutamate ABC transporter substrate-binding protein n=1 Tax=Rhodococcus opacus TaxID=37919 RepID=UPI001FF1F3A6|nr:glutamate ABC transporter substrate-binding protein [Rhodococcus opacus]UOT03243.1 glutamate ABC transporter substrate-binding protein [Rhodococcus opacus]
MRLKSHSRTVRQSCARRLAVVITAAVLTACTAPEALTPTATGDYSDLPLSDGASILPSRGTPPPEPIPPEACDALASLRPGPHPPPGQMPPGGSLAAIAARGRLIVGTDQNTNLFSFRDPTTGTLQGFDIDVAKEIARDLFGDPSKIEYRLLTSAGRFPALENGEVDIVVKSTTITCERAERVAFSTVYFQASQRLLVHTNSGITGPTELAGKRVCSVFDTTSLATIQRVAPEATIIAVPDWDDCLVTLQQGQADAVSTDDSILAGLSAQDPNLEITGPPLEPEPYGISVNRNEPDLVRFVNGTLDRLRADGTWTRLYDHWLAPLLGPTPTPPRANYRE